MDNAVCMQEKSNLCKFWEKMKINFFVLLLLSLPLTGCDRVGDFLESECNIPGKSPSNIDCYKEFSEKISFCGPNGENLDFSFELEFSLNAGRENIAKISPDDAAGVIPYQIEKSQVVYKICEKQTQATNSRASRRSVTMCDYGFNVDQITNSVFLYNAEKTGSRKYFKVNGSLVTECDGEPKMQQQR